MNADPIATERRPDRGEIRRSADAAPARSRRLLWLLLQAVALAVALPGAAVAQTATAGAAAELEAGRRIYVDGVLSSGAEATGIASGRVVVSGTQAACVNCHRPSGMGQVEGDYPVQPITGKFLYAAPAEKQLATMDPHVGKVFNRAHDPYTDATLAVAMRAGVNSSGRELAAVMPRYELSDRDMGALTAYLKQLSAQWSPGVTAGTIRLATVITPDVDAARRKIVIDTVRAIVRQKNGSTKTASQRGTRHHMTSAAELVLGTERNWDLQIWELQGAPESWGEQLAARYRAQPVFALVSGVSHSTWQPVHDFCEQAQVPCWFPSVYAPGIDQSPYALYFSGGVVLESTVLASHLSSRKASLKRLVQIRREGEATRAAAKALTEALARSGIPVSDRLLRADVAAADALARALDGVGPEDAIMFWLGPDDVKALAKIKPAPGSSYFSAVLAMGEHAPVPAAWRARSSLVYPYELPAERKHNLDYFRAWLNLTKLPLVDEALQSETFFAWNFLSDTISEMLDNLYREYLLERAETMLSIREGVKSEQETRDRVALGRDGDLARRHGKPTIDEASRIKVASPQSGSGKSEGTTLYPRLGLGSGQRFASKGAYIVRFANATGSELVAESEFIVPN